MATSMVATSSSEAAFATLTKARAQALSAIADLHLSEDASAIAGLAASRRLPLMGFAPAWPKSGTLFSYGAVVGTQRDYSRQAVPYVVRILHGAKSVELVINLKTAKALGLTIPQSLLLRADQVIE